MVTAPEYLGAGPDHDSVADRRVTLAALLAGAAQGYALVHRDIVPDDRRFADDHAHAVVDEQSPADGRAGVNLDPGQKAANVRRPAARQRASPLRSADDAR